MMNGMDCFERYLQDPGVGEIVSVLCRGSEALLRLFCKSEGTWRLELEADAVCGREGLGKEREGDMKTPEGDFGIITAFGLKDNPGTGLPYLEVTRDLYCCDEDGPEYNRFVRHACSGEHMSDYVPMYNYGLFIDYNKDGRYPLGSAIFVHVKSDKPYTSGCVAVSEPVMERLLRLLHPGARVVISSFCSQG